MDPELTLLRVPDSPAPEAELHDDIIYPATIPFVLVHLACFAAIWTGVTAQALALCFTLYLVRMFGNTAGNHRYFSHRTYKTSRVGQFLLALLAQSSAQRGVLWWAARHRHHHKHSDTPEDVHSPRHMGFFHAHVGWIFRPRREQADYSTVRDLTRFPELVWLNKHHYLPPFVLAVAIFLWGGWPLLIVGFFWSTVLLYHGTFMINSLAHVHGKQRYLTGDDSRNNWWLALITLGEGWHNNHHAYQSATRQGFRWWEIDVTYYILRSLAWTGVIWDLREPPAEVVRGERRVGRAVTERVARQLADTFPLEKIAARVRETLQHTPRLDELRERARAARSGASALMADASAVLAELHLPHVPTVEELRRRAEKMYAKSPSLDEVVEHARLIILQKIAQYVLSDSGLEPA